MFQPSQQPDAVLRNGFIGLLVHRRDAQEAAAIRMMATSMHVQRTRATRASAGTTVVAIPLAV